MLYRRMVGNSRISLYSRTTVVAADRWGSIISGSYVPYSRPVTFVNAVAIFYIQINRQHFFTGIALVVHPLFLRQNLKQQLLSNKK